jgi:hypothetical protein
MPIWSTDYLTRLEGEALVDIAKNCLCVVDRYAFEIKKNFALYQVPESFLGVRFIRWKGKLVRPLSNMEARYLFPGNTSEGPNFQIVVPAAFAAIAFNDDAFQVGESGFVPQAEEMLSAEPEFYGFSGINYRTIQFYGTPSENLPAQTAGLWAENIPNCAIMEFYRLPDEVNDKVLPRYFKWEMTKNFVLSRAFMKEGPGQRPDLAKYYESMYAENTKTLKEIMKAIQRGQMYCYSAPSESQHSWQPRARYPLEYGIPFYE